MSAVQSGSSLTPRDLVRAWWRVLNGHVPMLSIEITRECPLSCPGCYAYGDSHLGGGTTLRELSDFRGDELVEGVLELVRRHRPMHVSLVGGEPMVRHRELGRILPALSEMGVFTMVVTSGVIAIPEELDGNSAPARCGVGGRTPRASRRAPQAGDLRAHPQECCGAIHQCALGDHAANVVEEFLSGGIRCVLERATGGRSYLGEPV